VALVNVEVGMVLASKEFADVCGFAVQLVAGG
jgi:hypothetical protein